MEMLRILDTNYCKAATPTALCRHAREDAMCMMAYGQSEHNGVVQLYDVNKMEALDSVSAHDSPIQCLALSHDGSKLATTSNKGTVIRVFDVTPGRGCHTKLHEFRRSSTRCAVIRCLNFSDDSAFLAVASNTNTVHIFKLLVQQVEDNSTIEWLSSAFTSSLSATMSMVSSKASNYAKQERSFAYITLPQEDLALQAAIVKIKGVLRVVVCTSQATVLVYSLNLETGGPCELIMGHS